MEVINYEFERYIATKDSVTDVLNTYGVAIIPNVLTSHECRNMNAGMWDTLETLTENWDKKILRDAPETWREMRYLYPKHSMLIQNFKVGHAQYVWDIRQNQNVIDVFAKIWDCKSEELLVSFDGVSYHMPPEVTKLGWYRGNNWLHCDQSFIDSTFKCVQGWVTGYDVNEGDATLSILEKSHMFHDAFKNRFNVTDKKDWYKLNQQEFEFYIENGCKLARIRCPRGSLVLWDSRTIHCGTEALKTRETPNIRNVVYVCYEPRKNCSAKNLIKKQQAFMNMRMTSHWPCKVKLFGKEPRTYGGPLYEVNDLAQPILNDLGRKLAGF